MNTAIKTVAGESAAAGRGSKPQWADSLEKARAAMIKKRKLTGRVTVGSYGVTLDYDDVDPRNKLRRAFTCPLGHKWYAQPRFGKSKEGWDPPCPECMGRPGLAFKHEQKFPKGSKAFYSLRHPDERHQVAFECRGCFTQTGALKYVFDLTLRRYTNGLLAIMGLLRWKQDQDAWLWGRSTVISESSDFGMSCAPIAGRRAGVP